MSVQKCIKLIVLIPLFTGAVVFAGCSETEPEATKPATDAQIKHGAYMARAADCIACHTEPGGEPYTGGLRMDTPFGPIYSSNITPDDETGIGLWTQEEFYQALHDGVGRHHKYLYPVMPFSFYTKMTREDVDAIYGYLKSLKPINKPPKRNKLRFPFNVRLTMIGWRELFFDEGTYVKDQTKSAEWNRGAYLVEGPGHCSACHSPRNIMGAIEEGKQFTGAEVDHWFALNITSDLRSGIGDWSVNELAEFLRTGTNAKKTTALGPMAEVVHDSLSHLTDTDIRAMGVYLKSIKPVDTADETVPMEVAITSAAWRKEAALIYLDNCAACHQAKGAGIPDVFPPLRGNPVVNASSPDNLMQVVLKGIPKQGKYIPMPSFASRLSDQQIADVLNYVRTSWGNTAAPDVTPMMIAEWRKAQSE